MCHHKNTTCEIFFKTEENEEGRAGDLKVIKTFLLPFIRSTRNSVPHHHEQAISHIHRNSLGQTAQLLQGEMGLRRTVTLRALIITCYVPGPPLDAIHTNFFKSTFMRQEGNYEH